MGAAMSFSWERTAAFLRAFVAKDAARAGDKQRFDDGQRTSIGWIARRIQKNGIVLADEVGTGKTRIACAVVHAVVKTGGRAAVVVPHGLLHQWRHEADKLHMPPAKVFTTVRDFIQNAQAKGGADWKDMAPDPKEAEWLLVSHGFRAPQVRQGQWPAEWRVALPSYVLAELSESCGDRRTHAGKLHEDPDETTREIAQMIASRVPDQERVKLQSYLKQLPPFRRGGDNTALIEDLKGNGRELVENLLGLWLGEFHLVVIDEAHKSRGELDDGDADKTASKTATVLARLSDKILMQPKDGRRICLTATPMELDLSQWLELLRRARCGLDPERGRQVVARLHDAAKRAAVAPDEGDRLDELCAAAKDFRKTLAPYVTRRRRDEDPLVSSFHRVPGREGLPHPHRRLDRMQVGWTETMGQNSPWIDVLFAAECMSQSARGLRTRDTENWPRVVRDAYTKLSAGHVSTALFETSERLHVPEPGVVDPHTRGKMARTAYWHQRCQDGRKRVVEGLPRATDVEIDPDAEHPRILAAVKEIESWTLQREEPEKVLVFGVYLRPLKLLRDVLNVRHALRAADAGKPVAFAISDAKLRGIALLQLERMQAEGVLVGRLACGNGATMLDAHDKGRQAYAGLRKDIFRRAKKPVVAWRADPSLLGCAPDDRKVESSFRSNLVSYILDDFLAATSAPNEISDEYFNKLVPKFEDRLRESLRERGGDDTHDDRAEHRQKELREFVKDEDNDGRQSPHARLLHGETPWVTRRYLQAAFNQLGASPWVLIAQSQVGREGLNLDKSCRVVVQFHPEWNPAVLEQQIGRVDRKGSLWEKRARRWFAEGMQGDPPYIEVRQLSLEGTYDAFQWDRVDSRKHVFDASLFGSLLPDDALCRVPVGRLRDLRDAAPLFRPQR